MSLFQSTVNRLSPIKSSFEIMVPVVVIEVEMDKAYHKIGHQAKLKGFRAGKIPRKVLERYYRPQAEREVIEAVISAGFRDACDKHDIFPVSTPKVEKCGDIKIGEPLTFTLEVEVKPEVEVKAWEKLEVKVPTYSFEDADIDKKIAEIQKSQASVVEVEDRDIIEDDDLVTCDFKATVKGELNGPLSKQDESIHVGNYGFFPTVEKELIGKKLNESFEVKEIIADNYPNEALRGVEADLTVTPKTIKVMNLPVIDDEFAKDVSDKFETLEELRAAIKEQFEKEKADREEHEKKNNAIDALIQANEFEVPNSLVDRQAQDMAMNYLSQMVQPKQFEKLWQMTGGKFIDDAKPRAKRLIQASMLCDVLAKDHNIVISDEDLEAELDREADRMKVSTSELKTHYKPEDIESMRYRLKSDKVVDMVIEKASLVPEEKSLLENAARN